MSRWGRFIRLTSFYLRGSLRREWQLALLALVALAPGVAALLAWLNLAWLVRDQAFTFHEGEKPPEWLLPVGLLDAIGPAGVLVGAGVVTLLIGCLGLANAHLASVERRSGDMALLLALGARRADVAGLLLLEAFGLGLLGSGGGAALGIALSGLSWSAAREFFQLDLGFHLHTGPLLVSIGAGILATLLFVGVTAITTALTSPAVVTRRSLPAHQIRSWSAWRVSVLGMIWAALLAFIVALPILGISVALALMGLALVLAALLNTGSWLLTRLYRRLPTPIETPLWTLAIQSLARHPRHTAGMTLALTAGAYGVGLAAFSAMEGAAGVAFSIWLTGMVLVAGASLVLTTAALAALERRQELALLVALGARQQRILQLVFLEYGAVGVGGGALGASAALLTWTLSNSSGAWLTAVVIVVVDILATVVSAWAGATPALWRILRREPGMALREGSPS